MQEITAEVRTPDGAMPTFVCWPETGGPFAPVILFMDIWGIREELREIARRVATVGYCALLPDLYYRQGRGVGTGYRDGDGRMISLHRLDEDRFKEVQNPRSKVNSEMLMRDTRALIAHIDGFDAARKGPIGSVGWCMGGWLVALAAGRFPDRMRAGASLHGTRLISDAPDSPHLGATAFRGELYCGFGEKDHFSPPDLIAEWNALMAKCDVTYSHVVHAGAEHGYALPDRDIYDAQAAARDWERIFAMWRRVLGEGG
jgi:carboxymethylenebutenolidase